MTDELVFNGRPVPVAPGQTVAGALWSAGIRTWRTNRIGDGERGLYCGIGVCFDCRLSIDGQAEQRACLAAARPGAVIDSGGPDLESSGWQRSHQAAAAERRSRDDSGRRSRDDSGRRSRDDSGRRSRYDIAVIGAGPAGLAAAATAALANCRVALIDSSSATGGQFWRRRTSRVAASGLDPMGQQNLTGQQDGRRRWPVYQQLASIVAERVEHIAATSVYCVESGFTLHCDHGAGAISADRIVLAPGAFDRPLPFPGWDLPGVLTPGGAQALLKGSGVAIGQRVVVAGAGPFLLPVAVGLLRAGVEVAGVYEAGNPRRYLRRLGAVVGAPATLAEAGEYAAVLARHRTPYRTHRAVVAAHGADGLSSVDIGRLDGRGWLIPGSVRRVGCDAAVVGYGFTANVELALALGCQTRIGADGGLAVVVDADGRTSVPGVFAAGEITGVGGAVLAVVEGELAGAAAASDSGATTPLGVRELGSLRRRRDRMRSFAAAMHVAHAVPETWPRWLAPSTVICRCEEVAYGRVVAAVTELGATDARSVKLLTRVGMGWCQGRICGFPLARAVADLCDRPVTEADLVTMSKRPLATAVTLATLTE